MKMNKKIWSVYLSGEIHSDWRDQIAAGVKRAGLPIHLDGPNCVHSDSDDCGSVILGSEKNVFWHDRKSAAMNAIRTRTLIASADVVVVRFGEKFKQWNAAFDAGNAAALGKPLITLHSPEYNHAMKEIDAVALAVCETPEQVVQTLAYATNAELPRNKKPISAE